MKLSIIIAAFNVEKFIKKCVLSCLNQNLDQSLYEIVIVNDGSTDNTQLILEQIRERHRNIIIISQENSGLGASRNMGLKQSKGEFVWFIDGDDYIQENILKEILELIKDNTLDVLALDYSIVNDKYDILSACLNKLEGVTGIITGSDFYEKNYSNSYTVLFVFKRELFLANQIYFKERINMQDSEILPKIMLHCKRLSFFNKVCYYYVQHPNSFTNSINGEKRFKYFESIIEVRSSLLLFLTDSAKDNVKMTKGVQKKIEHLNNIVLNHLVFFPYEKEYLNKIIQLLKVNEFYPLKSKVKGKMRLIKIGMNLNPIFTKKIIDFLRK